MKIRPRNAAIHLALGLHARGPDRNVRPDPRLPGSHANGAYAKTCGDRDDNGPLLHLLPYRSARTFREIKATEKHTAKKKLVFAFTLWYKVNVKWAHWFAAGVATPILSCLLYDAGDALRSHGSWPSPPLLLLEVVLAAILGSPFSVPMLLALRLRHPWAAVPFISVAAAIGIGLQWDLIRHVEDSVYSVFTLFIWLVPAGLGIAAAFLLKSHWKLSTIGITILAIALVPALAVQGLSHARRLAPINADAASWSTLRVGMNVYTSYEGQTVCPTLRELLRAQVGGSKGCRTVAPGSPAIIDSIIPCKKTDVNWQDQLPPVTIHARHGSWRGFSEAETLQPDVPPGTVFVMHRDWGAPLALRNESGAPIADVGDSAIVRVLHYEPKRDVSLYVKILDGPSKGRMGWMAIDFADTGAVAWKMYRIEFRPSCEYP